VSQFEQGPTTPAAGEQTAGSGAVFAPVAVEILSSDGGFVQPPPRRRRTGLIAAVTTVAVLAAGVGGYAAWSAFNGGGSQPEDVLPASTIAFVKVDLDPSAGQKIELFKLLQKFPETAKLQGTDKDFGDWLVRRLVESDTSSSGIEFGRDIKPWLGKRFAVAGVPGHGSTGPVEGLVVLQETDEKAATASLEKIRSTAAAGKLDYAFADGYVVIAPGSTTAAHAALAAAQNAPLARDANYMSDIASLQSDQVVTAWADAGAVGKLLKQQASALSGLPGGGFGSLFDSTYQGRWVLGVHAADNTVEMQVKTFGSKPSPVTPAIAGVNHAASGAWGVIAISGMAQRVDSLWKQLSAIPEYKRSIGEAKTQLGIDLPGDLTTLLGSEVDLSIGGDLSAQPTLLAASTSANPRAAQAVLNRILHTVGAPSGVVAERVGADTLYVGSSPDAVDTAGVGNFAANPLYGEAVADPASAEMLGFVDLTRVWKAIGARKLTTPSQKEVENIAAIGFTGRHDGGSSSFTVRIVLR
jgi:Protein of unknown function (DUF3352)